MDESTALTVDTLLAHAGWMRALARRLVADPERADDVVQQSLVAAIEKPPRHAGNPTAWLGRVVTNTARQLGRGEERRRRRERAGAREEALPSTAELVLQAELQREVVSAILKLSEPQRSTVLLRFYRDHTPKEIAAMQGVPAATVRSRLKRALEELRADLDRRFDGDRRAWSTALLPFARGAAVVALGVGAKVALTAVVVVAVAALGWMLRPSAPQPSGQPDLILAAKPVAPAEAPGVQKPHLEEAESSDEREVVEEAAANTAGGTETYVGTVADPDGNPIEGATLTFYPKDQGNWRDQEPLVAGISDAGGSFAIPVPEGLDTERTILIQAEAAGHSSLSMDPVKPGHPISITLNWTSEVYGRVLDAETGAPIEGAMISAWGPGVTTGADGAYTLTGIPVEHRVHLLVNKEGYAGINEYRRLARREPTELDLRLQPGTPLPLFIFDSETKEPLSGVRASRYALDESVLAESEEDGKLTLYVLEGEELSVELHKEGYASFSWIWEVKDTTEPRAPRIPMFAFGWIEGSVTDAEGNAVEDAGFYATNPEVPFEKRVSTEDALAFDIPGYGSYEVPDDVRHAVSLGGFYSIAVIPDPNPFWVRGGSLEHVKVDAGPVHVARSGERVRQDIVLLKGGTVRGRILYNGGAWSRGDVYFENEHGRRGGYSRISGEGSYLLENVPAGTVTLKLRDMMTRSTVLPEVEVEVVAGREVVRDISWEEELVPLRGFVFEADGTPVADQGVGATWRRPNTDQYRRFKGKTKADGSFVIEVVPDRTYEVSVHREPAGDSVEDVAAGAEGVDGIELVLPTAGRVRFRLVDAQTGTSVNIVESDLWGIAWRESGAEVFAYVRRPKHVDGAIELEVPLREGTASSAIDLALYLNDDGYRPEQVLGLPVTPAGGRAPVVEIELERGVDCKLKLVGDEPLTLEKQRGHLFFLLHDDQITSLRGPFPDQGGPSNHRINGVNMWVGEPGLLYQMPEFDLTGFAFLQGLKPGRYTLRSFPEDFAFEPASFEVLDDKTTVEIRWRER